MSGAINASGGRTARPGLFDDNIDPAVGLSMR
jgi:hypothetical protein